MGTLGNGTLRYGLEWNGGGKVYSKNGESQTKLLSQHKVCSRWGSETGIRKIWAGNGKEEEAEQFNPFTFTIMAAVLGLMKCLNQKSESVGISSLFKEFR